MAVSASTQFDIAAPPSVVMEVLQDVESLPEWSGPHKSAEILEQTVTAALGVLEGVLGTSAR